MSMRGYIDSCGSGNAKRACLQSARREPWRIGPILAYANLFYTRARERWSGVSFATFGVGCAFPLHHIDGAVSRMLPNAFRAKSTEHIFRPHHHELRR